MKPWILLTNLVLVLSVVGGCSAPAEDETVAPPSPEPQQSAEIPPEAASEPTPTPVPPPIRLTAGEISERFTGADAASLIAEYGPPLEKEVVPFQDRLEAWSYRSELERGGHWVERIDFGVRYGRYVVSYGFPALIPADRRNQVMSESGFSAAVSGKGVDAIFETVGEPDWIHLRRDGTTAWEYCVWIQRDTTQFPSVILYVGTDGIVSGYSFNLNGTREVR